jgi:hypothetical protein
MEKSIDQAEIEAALAADDPEELLGIIIDLAMAAEDREFAEQCCIRLASHTNTDVRGNAIVGFAHLAARFGELDKETVLPVVVNALADDKEYVRDQAEVALDELNQLLGW